MNDSYDSTIRSLVAFIVANAPNGGAQASRYMTSLQQNLEQACVPDYFGIEFRPSDDSGCQLYVRIESPKGKFGSCRTVDEAGNHWTSYVVKCEISWSSCGSANVSTSQRQLAIMAEVTRFACEIERTFADVFYRLDRTAEEVRVNEAYHTERRAIQTVTDAVKNNAKGMKVGQEKVVAMLGANFMAVCPVEVERTEGGRQFKYRATAVAKDGFAFTRTA